MTYLETDGCLQFTPRQTTCPSWPVRIAGMQGLWRFVGPINETHVEVIGPYFPGNPARNGGRSRIVSLDKLKYAGKRSKPIDVRDVETEAVSKRAQRR